MFNTSLEPSMDTNDLSYYDILAMLCARITSLDETPLSKLFQAVNSSLDTYRIKAARKFAWLSLKGRPSLPHYNAIESSDLMELLEFAKSTDINDLAIVMGAISLIDTAMGNPSNFQAFIVDKKCRVISDDEDFLSDTFYAFDALNYNTKDSFGLVLPRLRCVWEKQSDRTHDTVALNPLALVLENHIWAPSDAGWKVNNLYTDIKGIGVYTALTPDMPVLKIISSPIMHHAPFTVELDNKHKKFYIHYQDLYDEFMFKRMTRIIDYSFKNSADIVVFPEMMGTEHCNRACKDYISNSSSRSKPKLYILPSREYLQDGQWYNTVDILDEDGDCVFKYHKKHPFILDIKKDNHPNISYYEPIESDGNICVIHVPGVGRIGIIICSDIFKDGYLQWLLKNLKLTLLLYPVCSFGKDALLRDLSAAHIYSCDVLMCNTCAAWDEMLLPHEGRKDVDTFDRSFISAYYPYGHLLQSTITPLKECSTATCAGCLFVTTISNSYKNSQGSIEQKRLECD